MDIALFIIVLVLLFFLITIIRFLKRKVTEKNKEFLDNKEKWEEFYGITNLWIELLQNGNSLKYFFKGNNYSRIAIYGYRELGERLFNELNNNDVEVVYIIDQNADAIYAPRKVFLPTDELPEVDVVVVTSIHYFDQIKGNLSDKVNCPVVNLFDVVKEVSQKQGMQD